MDVQRCARAEPKIPRDLSADLRTLVGVHFKANKQAFNSVCGNGPQVAPDIDHEVVACQNNTVTNGFARNRPTITYDTVPGVDMYTIAMWDAVNQFCHMLVFNAYLDAVDNSGYTVFPYTPPLNPFPTHNPYIIAVYAQRGGAVDVDAADVARWITKADDLGARFSFNLTATADKYGLGPPIGMNWIMVGPDEYGGALWTHDLNNAYWIPQATRDYVVSSLDPVKKTCDVVNGNAKPEA